jgi:hypothetical protein
MKQTSNKLLNYPGHIDCRSSSLIEEPEWERKSSVILRAALRVTRLAARSSTLRSNLNSDFMDKKIND